MKWGCWLLVRQPPEVRVVALLAIGRGAEGGWISVVWQDTIFMWDAPWPELLYKLRQLKRSDSKELTFASYVGSKSQISLLRRLLHIYLHCTWVLPWHAHSLCQMTTISEPVDHRSYLLRWGCFFLACRHTCCPFTTLFECEGSQLFPADQAAATQGLAKC